MTARIPTFLALAMILPTARADETAFGVPTRVRLTQAGGLSRTFTFSLKPGDRIRVMVTSAGPQEFSGEFLGVDGQTPLPGGAAGADALSRGWTSPPAIVAGAHGFRLSARAEGEVMLVITLSEEVRVIAKDDPNARLQVEVQKLQRGIEAMAAANAQLSGEVNRLQARVATLEARAAESARFPGELQMLRSRIIQLESGMTQLRVQVQMKK